MDTEPTTPREDPVRIGLACLALLALTLLVYARIGGHGFSMYDDHDYVVDNEVVQGGLTPAGVSWAFGFHGYAANWHPLTWLSHMLDVELFGDAAGGHHWVSVLLHAANGVLLFAALFAMTRAFWPCAVSAALFALHPTRVESVAWVAERKDVLSGFFFLLTLIAYASYARHGGWVRYGLTGLALMAGLLTKPMLVSLPLLLLVLDFWPLARGSHGVKRLVLEKVPFLLLAALGSLGTLLAQRQGGAVSTIEAFSLLERIVNTPIAYVAYVGKFLLPVRLAVFYPHPALVDPDGLTSRLLLGGLCLATLLLLSWVAWRARSRRPYLLAGWLWFLGLLVPVIGLVQVGSQQFADRYHYLPGIGLIVMLVWTVWAGVQARPRARVLLLGTSLGALLWLGWQSFRQVNHWRTDRLLFEHALAVTTDNFLAHNNLGVYLNRRGKFAQAIPHFEAALEILPDYGDAHSNLGTSCLRLGNFERAEESFRHALRLHPRSAQGHFNLGLARSRQRDDSQAQGLYQRAIELDPDMASAYVNRSASLQRLGRLDEATALLTGLIARQPGLPRAHLNLGHLYLEREQDREALEHFRRGLELAVTPADRANGLASLAWIQATSQDASLRDGAAALRQAKEASDLAKGRVPDFLSTWAAALAECGDFPAAVEKQKRALESVLPEREEEFRRRLEVFEAGKPYRR